MPFTPFHLGLGVAAKAAAPRRISFQVFALAQVLMDTEPGVRMALGQAEVHGWGHTWAGAAVVAVLVLPLWRLVEGRRWYRWTVEHLPTSVVATSAVLGTFSHVALDAMIHADMVAARALWRGGAAPLWSHGQAEIVCLLAAVLGSLLLGWRLGKSGVLRALRDAIENLSASPAFGSPANAGLATTSTKALNDGKSRL